MHMDGYDLKQIMVFHSCVRNRNITRAAEELFMSQQAVSKSIKSLEGVLGTVLFYRTNKGITLTDKGREFYLLTKPAVESYENMREDIEIWQQRGKRDITIGVANGLILTITYEKYTFLREFLYKRFPKINFLWVELPDLTIERRIEEKTLDIGLSLRPVEHDDLCFDLVVSDRLYMLIASGDELAKRHEVTFADARNKKLVLVSPDMQFNASTKAMCVRAGFEPEIFLTCSEISTILAYVKKGQAIFYGIESIPEEPGVTKVRLRDDFYWDSGIVYREDMKKDPLLRLVLKNIRSVLLGSE